VERSSADPVLRLARLDEADAIDDLMKASTRDIFPTVYTPEQTASAIRYVAAVDLTLLRDGTYFVFEAGVELVACGGWSKRARLYSGSGDADGDDRLLDPATEAAHVRAMFTRSDWTRRGFGRRILEACEAAAGAEGFRRLTLGATLPGLPLYESFGFEATGREDVMMPDGVTLACVWMDKPIA
jgi:GNAT superfamily N-acetyltransferase